MRTGGDGLLLLSDALELRLSLASDGGFFLGACVGVERVNRCASCLAVVEITLKLSLLVQSWTKIVSFGHRTRHEGRGDGERYVGGAKKQGDTEQAR